MHWPQPQFQDFDRYLELFGVEQVREVLMDRSRHHLELDTQVNRTAVREYDPQRVALPFLIRALGANHSSSSPVTGRLGDLLFIWGNRFRVDAGALGEAGLRAQVLATTTDRAWSYDWNGGFLKEEDLRETGGYLPGRQSLALTLEGPLSPRWKRWRPRAAAPACRWFPSTGPGTAGCCSSAPRRCSRATASSAPASPTTSCC